MKTFFRHFRFGAFAVALLCAGLGAAILFFPEMSQQVFCYAFGGVLCLCGVFQIASYLVGSQKNLLAKMMFVGGVIAAVAGVWILFDPSKVLTLTIIVMGIVLIYHGAMDVKYGFDIKNSQGKAGAAIIFGLLTCGVGVLLLVNPFGDNISLLFTVCGVGFLFDGVTDLYTVTAVATAEKRYELAAAAANPILDAPAAPAGIIEAPAPAEEPVSAETTPAEPEQSAQEVSGEE